MAKKVDKVPEVEFVKPELTNVKNERTRLRIQELAAERAKNK